MTGSKDEQDHRVQIRKSQCEIKMVNDFINKSFILCLINNLIHLFVYFCWLPELNIKITYFSLNSIISFLWSFAIVIHHKTKNYWDHQRSILEKNVNIGMWLLQTSQILFARLRQWIGPSSVCCIRTNITVK